MLSISDSFEVEVTLWLSYLNTNIFQIFCQVVNLVDYAECGIVSTAEELNRTEVYIYYSPVLAVYTPMCIVWVTFIEAVISQR